jgi:hypothetical protein
MAVKPTKNKPYTIYSDNPKMDTSGMAGKPQTMEIYEYKQPPMTIDNIMEEVEKKTNKRPEVEHSNMKCRHY